MESTDHQPVIHPAGTESHPTVTPLTEADWLTAAAAALANPDAEWSAAAVYLFAPESGADIDAIMPPLLSTHWTRPGDLYGHYGTGQRVILWPCGLTVSARLIHASIQKEIRRASLPVTVGIGALARKVWRPERHPEPEPEYPHLSVRDLLAVAEADLIVRQLEAEMGLSW